MLKPMPVPSSIRWGQNANALKLSLLAALPSLLCASCSAGRFDVVPNDILFYFDAKHEASWADGGTTWRDRSTFGNHAEIKYDGSADTARTSCEFNRTKGYITMKGLQSQHIELTNPVSLSRTGSTLLFWHKPPPDGNAQYGLLGKCHMCGGALGVAPFPGAMYSYVSIVNSPVQRAILSEVNANNNHFGPTAGAGAVDNTSLSAGSWWAVAVVMENSQAKWLYSEDGGPVKEFQQRSTYGDDSSLTRDLVLQHFAVQTREDPPAQGKLAAVLGYSRALTKPEIKRNFDALWLRESESDGCTACPAGTAKTTASNDGCSDCPSGKFSLQEATSCSVCLPGQYQDDTQASSCKDCPIGTNSSSASTNVTDCVAIPTTSSLIPTTTSSLTTTTTSSLITTTTAAPDTTPVPTTFTTFASVTSIYTSSVSSSTTSPATTTPATTTSATTSSAHGTVSITSSPPATSAPPLVLQWASISSSSTMSTVIATAPATTPVSSSSLQPRGLQTTSFNTTTPIPSRVTSADLEPCPANLTGTNSTLTKCQSEAGREIASSVSALVSAAVAMNVAAAVATSVAASVGGSVAGVVSGSASAAAAGTGGGSASASSSSSGGAGALFLINQVQFLSLVGRFGKGDESAMTGFSDSFRWANLDFQVTRAWVPPQEGDARRNEKHGSSSKAVPKKIISGRTNSTHGSAECAVYGDCSLYCHRDIVEGIVTLMATLLLVYVSRVAVRALVERVKPDTDLSALAFPVWEGPVFISEFLGICDMLTRTFVSTCNGWVVMGSGLFVLGPTLVFIYVAVQLVSLHRTGSLVFVAGEKKSMKEIWNEARGKGCLGMPIHIVNELSSMRTLGDWEATDDRAEVWLWMLGDFSESGWYYPALQLARKLFITTVITTTAGNLKSWMVSVIHLAEVPLLWYSRPFNDIVTVWSERIAVVTNTLAVFSVTMPAFGIDFLPDVVVIGLATIGTGLAALSSSLSSFMALGHLLLQGPAWCCATSPAVPVIPGAAVAAGGVAASSDLIYQYAREQGEEYLWGEGDDKGDKEGDEEAATNQEDCTGSVELSGKVELRIVQFGSPGTLHTELLASDKSRSGRSFLPQGIDRPFSSMDRSTGFLPQGPGSSTSATPKHSLLTLSTPRENPLTSAQTANENKSGQMESDLRGMDGFRDLIFATAGGGEGGGGGSGSSGGELHLRARGGDGAENSALSRRRLQGTAALTEDLLCQRSGRADEPEQYQPPARPLERRRIEI